MLCGSADMANRKSADALCVTKPTLAMQTDIYLREPNAQLHYGLRDSLDAEAFRSAHCDDTMLCGNADVANGKGADALGVTKALAWFLMAPTERSATCCEYSGMLAATKDAYGTNLHSICHP